MELNRLVVEHSSREKCRMGLYLMGSGGSGLDRIESDVCVVFMRASVLCHHQVCLCSCVCLYQTRSSSHRMAYVALLRCGDVTGRKRNRNSKIHTHTLTRAHSLCVCVYFVVACIWRFVCVAR